MGLGFSKHVCADNNPNAQEITSNRLHPAREFGRKPGVLYLGKISYILNLYHPKLQDIKRSKQI